MVHFHQSGSGREPGLTKLIKHGTCLRKEPILAAEILVCIEFLESQHEQVLEATSSGAPVEVLPDGRELGLRRHICCGSYLDGKPYR